MSYSLPATASSPRVTLWRRLKRLGAISPTGSLFILPHREECLEAFQWLAREIRQAEGEALVMYVPYIEGFDDAGLIEMFHRDRGEAYASLIAQVADFEQQVEGGISPEAQDGRVTELHSLQKRFRDLWQIDYFQSPAGVNLAARLSRLAQAVALGRGADVVIEPLNPADYCGATWVTRPHPHVDRLASIWLIRRFVDPDAKICYRQKPAAGEIPFDYDSDRHETTLEFTHRGSLCTFEVMIRTFQFDDPAVAAIAEIVHEIDLRDGLTARPETAGIDAVLQGWLHSNLSDEALENHGVALFDGLFAALKKGIPDVEA